MSYQKPKKPTNCAKADKIAARRRRYLKAAGIEVIENPASTTTTRGLSIVYSGGTCSGK